MYCHTVMKALHLSQIEYLFPGLGLFLEALPQHSDLEQGLKSMYSSASHSFWPVIGPHELPCISIPALHVGRAC